MPPKKPSPVKATKTVARPAVSKGPTKAAVKKPTGPKGNAGASTGSSRSTSGAQKSQPGKQDVKKKGEAKPLVKKWTREDEAALKIQVLIRQFLSRVALERKKKEKEAYDELMDKLEREAFAKVVKMQQEQAEKQREKEDVERKRKREEVKKKKRMLEAAFDGDNEDILAVLKEVNDLDDKSGIGTDPIGQTLRARHQLNMVDCEDANNNTPLSEGSSGGHIDTVKMLIERGADLNSRGRFRRTPLYRAAFAGHLDVCQVLLTYGADPRLYADDGQTPEQVASQSSIQELLADWDIEQTETLLGKIEGAKQLRQEADRKRREAEMSKTEQQMIEAQKEFQMRQKQLCKVSEELNKRIYEHDFAVESGFEKAGITLQPVHEHEAEVEITKMELEKARDRLSQLRLKLREQQMEGTGEGEEDDLPGVKVTMRELDDVLLRDVGNRIEGSGKWPLIIDPSAQAATFLRYRDTNYVNALSPPQMEPQKVRLALLGAIRYGKPFVLDMMDVDMFDTCAVRFDMIWKGLMDEIMNKSLLKDERYKKLIEESDGDAYAKNQLFRDDRFKFFIITKNPFPADSLLENTYPIRVHIPS